jgi:putative glutamine amidotransferase
MAQRPLIGITTDYNSESVKNPGGVVTPAKSIYKLPCTYAAAIELAGGLPVLIPYKTDVRLIGQYLDQFDGIVLAGGDDLDPSSWGETYHDKAQRIDPDRQQFEFAMLAEIERRRLPVLGICLGSQVMNVYRGGSLHQFLPDVMRENPLDHRLAGDWSRRHAVTIIEPDSHIARATGQLMLETNTSHKQAVHQLGRNLRITAVSSDGIIEGTEDPSFNFYVGIQWHPERQHTEPAHHALFQRFIQHC